MKLKYTFEAVEMGDEIIMVPVGDNASEVHGVIKLNAQGREIVDALQNDTTEEKIIQMLTEKYSNTASEMEQYVKDVIGVLKNENLLDL